MSGEDELKRVSTARFSLRRPFTWLLRTAGPPVLLTGTADHEEYPVAISLARIEADRTRG